MDETGISHTHPYIAYMVILTARDKQNKSVDTPPKTGLFRYHNNLSPEVVAAIPIF